MIVDKEFAKIYFTSLLDGGSKEILVRQGLMCI